MAHLRSNRYITDPATGRHYPIPAGGAPGGGGEGGGGEEGGQPPSGQGDKPPAGQGGQPPGDGDDKTFTEDDVNRIVQKRLAREREKYSDYEDLAEKAKQFDELEDQRKSELEKAQERTSKLERELEQAQLQAQETRLHNAVLAEAAKKGVIDPDAAVQLLDRSLLEWDDDGNPTNIAEAMDSLLDDRPYLAGQHGGRPNGSADQGARGRPAGSLTREDLKTMSPEQINKARKEGQLDHLMGRTS